MYNRGVLTIKITVIFYYGYLIIETTEYITNIFVI